MYNQKYGDTGIYGLEKGDMIIANKNFMSRNKDVFVDSRFIVKECWKGGQCDYTLENYHNGREYNGSVSLNDFYPVNDVNLNQDVTFILRNYELKSFNATTMCGKVINVELPSPYRIDLNRERKINIEKRD